MLCNCFRPRQQLEAEILVLGINSTFFGGGRHVDRV